jgi:hypothetical protein
MGKQPDEQLDTLDMSTTSRLKRVRMAYKKSQEENQRLRELLQRAREMHHIAYGCDCVICSLWREIDEELGDGR